MTQFEKYLEKQMDSRERYLFEQELKTNPKLKKEFTAFLLDRLRYDTGKSQEDRDWIRSVYREGPAVQAAAPSPFYIGKRFVIAQWPKLAAAAVLVLGVLYITLWSPQLRLDEPVFVQRVMIEPVSMERASSEQIQAYEKASYFYYQSEPMVDSLEAIARRSLDFDLSQYYLAHAYLKTGQFAKAAAMFDKCLAYADQLERVPQLQGSLADIKLNALIAHAASDPDKEGLVNELDSLIEKLDPKSASYSRAQELRSALK
jgi:tetratricopeptide (TPR) repeat protein